MWWPGKKEDKPAGSVATTAIVSPASASTSVQNHINHRPRERIPEGLQKIIERSDRQNAIDDAYEGYAPDSTESNVRYAAYLSRIRTVVTSAHRYVAYTSDIGESFRPVVNPSVVRTAYGISWAYLIGDVSFEGYKAYWSNQRILNPTLQLTPSQQKWSGLPADGAPTTDKPGTDGYTTVVAPGTVALLDDWRTVVVQRALFQGLASMGLPAFTIHSVVKYSGKAMKDMKNKVVRTWGPIGLGLVVVPFLPALFDEPVENAVEWTFHRAFLGAGGPHAVEGAPATGREKLLGKKPKDKEL